MGFTSFLTTFFHEQYHVSRVSAGDFTTIVVVSGSLMRPLGGWLSDRIGGYRLLLLLLGAVAVGLGVVATLPPLALVVPMLFLTVGCLGMGNGAVFQLVPQRFAGRMGIITGIVGAAGGLGGFFLPSILGAGQGRDGHLRVGPDAVLPGVRGRLDPAARARLALDGSVAAGSGEASEGLQLSR